MTKRAKIFWVTGLLLLAGTILLWRSSSQPVYQGKSMRWWLRQAPADWDLDAQVAQREALRSFGTAALPDLLARVASRMTWRDPLERMDDWLHQISQQRLMLLDRPDGYPDVCRQLEMLGELADPAVAELAALAQAEDIYVYDEATMALAAIGTSHALGALAPLLNSTNPALRLQTARALSSYGPRANHLAPALLRQAADPDPNAARCAVVALCSIATEAAPLIPLFTNALTSGDRRDRHVAIHGLRSLGSAARPAAPALSNFVESINPASDLHQQLLETLTRLQCDVRDGAIVRGPRDRKQIALLFTGHEFAEGAGAILSALGRHEAKASFFLTGSFLTNAAFAPLVQRIAREGHYQFIHSDQHLLYCSWERPPRTLVSRWDFEMDVKRNHARMAPLGRTTSAGGVPAAGNRFFVPPYEHWNREIAHWARQLDYELIGYTPGTRANADYTEDGAPNFVSSQAIFDSILAREREDPNGLNGFLLLFHLGAGPKRTDKFHTRLDELLTVLSARGYTFVRVDELLNWPPANRY
jgi:peptidoglycan/xylan/chitin deacetylase (PgdA/CDA1 family)